jgi:hypothetical protein
MARTADEPRRAAQPRPAGSRLRRPCLGTIPGRGRNGRGRVCRKRDASSTSVPARLERRTVVRNGPTSTLRLLRRLLPRHRARRRADPDLSRRRRLPLLPRAPRHGRQEARLAAPCVLPDDEPLPPRRRDDRGAALGRLPAPQRVLRADLQRTAWPLGPPLRRALLERSDRERGGARRGVPLRDREPRPSRTRQPRGRLAVQRLALRPATRRRRRSRSRGTPAR